MPNLAARVSALAAPGQILVEGSHGFGPDMTWQREGSFAFLPLSGDFSSTGIKTEQIELQQLGYYLLKVWRIFSGELSSGSKLIDRGPWAQVESDKS